MSTALVTATSFIPPQIEGANFLNLMIIDDERAIREVCKEVAQSMGFNSFVADSAEHGYRMLETQNIDVVLLDLRLPGAGGLEALHQIKARRPDAVIVVVTGYGTVQSAVQAMKNGAYDYVTKPFSMEELRLLLERVAGHLKLKTENRILREKVKSKQGFGGIVGRAPEMEKLYRIIAKAAHSTHPVLILGESGTGKEMVARDPAGEQHQADSHQCAHTGGHQSRPEAGGFAGGISAGPLFSPERLEPEDSTNARSASGRASAGPVFSGPHGPRDRSRTDFERRRAEGHACL